MEFKELIAARRSCRAYQDVAIEKAVIEDIIKDTLQAPTWKNSETGRYYIAISPEAKEKVKNALPEFNQRNSANCSAYVITTFVKGQSGYIGEGKPADYIQEGWGAYDLGLQNAYFTLSAVEHGYDTLIMGLRDEAALRDIFNIPENEQLMAVLSLGKRAKELVGPQRKAEEDVAKYF